MSDDGDVAPADVVRRVVRQWSDAQLRLAWRTSGHGLQAPDPGTVARSADVRAVLLGEWERRHPSAPGAWSIGELD